MVTHIIAVVHALLLLHMCVIGARYIAKLILSLHDGRFARWHRAIILIFHVCSVSFMFREFQSIQQY